MVQYSCSVSPMSSGTFVFRIACCVLVQKSRRCRQQVLHSIPISYWLSHGRNSKSPGWQGLVPLSNVHLQIMSSQRRYVARQRSLLPLCSKAANWVAVCFLGASIASAFAMSLTIGLFSCKRAQYAKVYLTMSLIWQQETSTVRSAYMCKGEYCL